LPVYDFRCDKCETVKELIRKHEVKEVPCAEEKCKGTAHRQVSYPGAVYGNFCDNNREQTNRSIENMEKKLGQSLGGGDTSE